jgi:hypothetical protein
MKTLDCFDPDERESISDTYTSRLEAAFHETSNPLYVWAAIYLRRHDPRPYPRWILDYLETSANNLLLVENTDKRAPEIIKQALRFTSGKYFEEYHNDSIKYEIYDRYNELCARNPSLPRYRIDSDIAEEYGISPETVRKYRREINRIVNGYLED